MANKRPKLEEIVTKLRQVEVLTGQGMPRLDAIRQIGMTEQTYYRWKKKYGGMGTDQVKELPERSGWGGRIRTYDTRYQKPLPYHLATPQRCPGH